jgi:hypothetical protein
MNHAARRFFVVAAVIILSGSLASADAQDACRRKKLIECGWDMPDSQHLAGILDQVEKQPFDGVVVQAIGRKDDGSAISLGWGFLDQKWKREWFQSSVDQLKKCKFRRFTDNFVIFNANPGNVDWFDDGGWKNIVEHWRIAAWIARQSGFKGICFDPEPYAPPSSQFSYSAQAGHDKHTFAEYCKKSRQRGREVMRAVTEEYPNITILSFFLNSNSTVQDERSVQADLSRWLAPLGHGLLPAMLDGWLDVAPPTVTVVDGHEPSYPYNSRGAFLEAGNMIRNNCQNLVAPENRAKYRAQVQVGFGIYLDSYWNPKDNPWGWYIDGRGGTRVGRLRENVCDAMSIADEYVWVYGEQFRWWPTPNGAVKPQSWAKALPGCDQMLCYARDPIECAGKDLAKLRASGKGNNLARNGNFSSAKALLLDGKEVVYHDGGNPAGWDNWQTDKSKGTFTWDRHTNAAGGPPGAARIAGVADGCLSQTVHVQPGERYVISAAQRVAGKGQGLIRVRWSTAGKWACESQDVFVYPRSVADSCSAPWSSLLGTVHVPEGVDGMVVLLSASEQTTASDVIWYDNVEVYKLP